MEQIASVMKDALADLRNQYTSGLARLSARWTLDSDVKAQEVSAFSTSIRNAIDTLDRLRAAVMSGMKSFEQWAELANGCYRDMSDQLGYSDDWALSSVLANTVSQSAQDLKTGAVAVVGGAAALLPVVVLGLVAIVVLRFQR